MATDAPDHERSSLELSVQSGTIDQQFLDDLSAANRLKSFLVGRGQRISEDASRGIAQLVSDFASDLAEYESRALRATRSWNGAAFTRHHGDQPANVKGISNVLTPAARADLDFYIRELAYLGDAVTIDDFRVAQMMNAKRTALLVRSIIIVASVGFMMLALSALAYATKDPDGTPRPYLAISAIWALALGGLGAVANIFINILKLIPQQTLRTSDVFEVVGRIILGCLFSTILATTLVANVLVTFFKQGGEDWNFAGGLFLLSPFLAGYSITLVLGVLEKTIRAFEITIGLNDRALFGVEEQRDATSRKKIAHSSDLRNNETPPRAKQTDTRRD
jgi:hypothetical protein